MQNLSTKEELQTLLQQSQGYSVSMFLPTHRAGVGTLQGRIRLKNLLREVEQRLLACLLRSNSVKAMLEPIQALLDDALFWQYQRDGLAIFRSSDMFRLYYLPYPVEEGAVVGRRFHLKPLLPFLADNERFYLLALSQNTIRLFEGSSHDIREMTLPEAIPRSLAEIQAGEDAERHLQVYAGIGGGRIPPAMYRKANTYTPVLDQRVTGNPDTWSREELHQQVWKIGEPYFQQKQDYAAAQYRQYASTKYVSNLASNDIKAIVPSAYYGRVASLFVAIDRQQWGTFDPDTTIVTIHRHAKCDNEDLLDCAAIRTLLHGGAVYAVEQRQVPGETLAAAVFRYQAP